MSGLTPGDPLGTPERPDGAYGGRPVPPGAFTPRPGRPAAPTGDALASFGRRLVAVLVDGVIVAVLILLALTVAGVLIGDDAAADDDDSGLVLALGFVVAFTLAYPFVALLYLSTVMAATNGQTLGKMASGCRVVRADGKPVGFWWAAWREAGVKGLILGIAGTVTGGIAYLVNFLWPLWDRQNRALHDYVVDSRVVRTRRG